MKRISIFIMLFLLSFFLFSCNSNDNNISSNLETNNNQNLITTNKEKEVKMAYLASYSKMAGPMGVLTGGHYIVFYEDNTLEINVGFFAPVGNHMDKYSGTYTLDGNKLHIDYDYIYVNDDSETKKGSVDTSIENDTFRAQIYMCATFPDDGKKPNQVGLTYHKMEYKPFSQKNILYIGLYETENNFKAYILELTKDNTFNINLNQDGNYYYGTGSYEIEKMSLDEDDKIHFTYDIYDYNNKKIGENHKDTFVYTNDLRFSFNYLYNETSNSDLVNIVRFL